MGTDNTLVTLRTAGKQSRRRGRGLEPNMGKMVMRRERPISQTLSVSPGLQEK